MKPIFFYLLASVCMGDQFVADLADRPGYNTGTMVVEAGVCGLASWGGKALMDSTLEGRKYDFMPAVGLSVAGLLVHSVFFREGGSKANDALIEQGFESAGAFSPVVFNF